MDVLIIIAIILFIAGFILIGIEMFAPGFGWPGTIGIICFVGGVFLVSESFVQGVIVSLIVAAICGLLFWIIMRLLAKGKLKSPLILKDEMNDNSGYVGNRGLSGMVGAVGTAVTDMRPTGVARFGDDELDVVSSGKFILKGSEIEVIKAEGYRLVVREREQVSKDIIEIAETGEATEE